MICQTSHNKNIWWSINQANTTIRVCEQVKNWQLLRFSNKFHFLYHIALHHNPKEDSRYTQSNPHINNTRLQWKIIGISQETLESKKEITWSWDVSYIIRHFRLDDFGIQNSIQNRTPQKVWVKWWEDHVFLSIWTKKKRN